MPNPYSACSLGYYSAAPSTPALLLLPPCGQSDRLLEEWNRTVQTNLAAVLLGEGDPGSTAYVAKFGLHGFARALLCEVRHDSIRVVALKRAAARALVDAAWLPPESLGMSVLSFFYSYPILAPHLSTGAGLIRSSRTRRVLSHRLTVIPRTG